MIALVKKYKKLHAGLYFENARFFFFFKCIKHIEITEYKYMNLPNIIRGLRVSNNAWQIFHVIIINCYQTSVEIFSMRVSIDWISVKATH